jgi:hypothetical protein
MWDWIKQETTKSASSRGRSEYYDKRYEWRSVALRALVDAKAHLATNRSLDAALETYLRGIKVPCYIHTGAASNFCHRMLACIRNNLSTTRSYDEMRNELAFTNTSPALWDEFYTEVGRSSGGYAEYNQAIMKLNHLKHPDPWPLFKFWRQAEHDGDHMLRRVKTRTGATARVEVSRDMRLVLGHQGYHEEAEWAKVFTNQLFPLHSRPKGRSRRERLTLDGKPLPSLATRMHTSLQRLSPS